MSKHSTIKKGSKQRNSNGGLDQYYTRQYIADFVSNIVKDRYGIEQLYLEPSAGTGSFMQGILPNIIGFDLEPKAEGIIKKNFFKLQKLKDEVVVIGNPPFGTSSNLAIKFFNHSANELEAKAIAFILPMTFKKRSVQNKLSMDYGLVSETVLPTNSFIVDGSFKNVPCVFQIWERLKIPRKPDTLIKASKWISFTTKDKPYDVAIRRAGSRAGQIVNNGASASTYFLKVESDIVIKALQLMDISEVNYTAGIRSISKPELCTALNKVMEVLC
jgi:hypothetical protein